MNIANLLREVAARLDSIVGLREYGAALDGATDDLPALQRAAEALAGREVTLLVSGPCFVSAAITLPATAKVRFEGAGAFTGPGAVSYTAWQSAGGAGGEAAAIPGYTSATRPAAGAAWWRKLIAVKDAGQPETVQACIQTSAGGYTWVIVAVAGS